MLARLTPSRETLRLALTAGCIAALGDVMCQFAFPMPQAQANSEGDDVAAPASVAGCALPPASAVPAPSADVAVSSRDASTSTSTSSTSAAQPPATLTWSERLAAGRACFDRQRFLAVALFGFAVSGPVGSVWYPFLDRFVRRRWAHVPVGSWRFVLTKFAIEQAVMGPCMTATFFPCVSVVEGGESLQSLPARMKKDFLPTLAFDEAVWTCVAPITFKYVPVQRQLLFNSSVSVFENMFLSFVQHAGFPNLGLEEAWARHVESRFLPASATAAAAAAALHSDRHAAHHACLDGDDWCAGHLSAAHRAHQQGLRAASQHIADVIMAKRAVAGTPGEVCAAPQAAARGDGDAVG